MPRVICEPCVKAAECVQVCPVDCIHDAGDQYVIDPNECIDCGACEDACPSSAIFPMDEVPAQWSAFIEKNANFFNK